MGGFDLFVFVLFCCSSCFVLFCLSAFRYRPILIKRQSAANKVSRSPKLD